MLEMTDSKKGDDKAPLVQRLEELEAQLTDFEARMTAAEEQKNRALADMENFRRRETEQRQNWTTVGIAEWLKRVLPTLFELQLGGAHTQDEDVKKVIEKFFGSLSDQGLQVIVPAEGDEVNPEFHEVLLAEKGESGKIIRVLEPGWQFREIVLVPAKVSAGNE